MEAPLNLLQFPEICPVQGRLDAVKDLVDLLTHAQRVELLDAIATHYLNVSNFLTENEMDSTFADEAYKKLVEGMMWVSQFDE